MRVSELWSSTTLRIQRCEIHCAGEVLLDNAFVLIDGTRRSKIFTPAMGRGVPPAKLRDECLRVSWFGNLFEARRKIAAWRAEYNQERPHSSLGYRTPEEFAREMRGEKGYGKDGGFAHLENAPRFPLSHSHGDGVTLTNAEQFNGPEVVS